MTEKDHETGKFIRSGNEWEIKDGIVYCYRNNELLFFTDDRRVLEYSWSKFSNGYSSAWINGVKTSAHRFISRPESHEVVDHINRNKQDNTRHNLRNTNRSMNAYNSKIRKNNTSGKTGVHFRPNEKLWIAEIVKNGKTKYLGCFKEYADAVKVRNDAERKYYAY